MRLLFWTSAILIAITYFGYPAWLWTRRRWHSRPWQRMDITPSVSIILAVHNGAARIREKIAHLVSLDYPQDRTEVIVVSDGSSDGTAGYLANLKHPRLHVIVCEEHRGKAAALNLAMRAAQNDILLFVDIRPRLEAHALRRLMSNFADATVGCAAGELLLDSAVQDAGSSAVSGLYWRYEQCLRVWESEIDSPCGVYGGFYAIRRELATALPDGLILDDVYQPMSIIRQGYRSVLDVDAHVFDQWPETARGEFQRKVRTLAGNFQLLRVAPWLLGKENRVRVQLVFHKLLRLAVPYWLMVTFVSSLALAGSTLYLLLFFCQLSFYLLAVIGSFAELPILRRVAGGAVAFCLLNGAAIAGLWRFLFNRGPLWKIWTSPANIHISVPEREHEHSPVA